MASFVHFLCSASILMTVVSLSVSNSVRRRSTNCEDGKCPILSWAKLGDSGQTGCKGDKCPKTSWAKMGPNPVQIDDCKGNKCSKTSWTQFGDSDPHITTYLQGSKLDRPLCYDLNGTDGEVYSLYQIGSDMSVNTGLVASPRRHHEHATYFGEFAFTTNTTSVVIAPYKIIVHEFQAGEVRVYPWRHWVSRTHSTIFSDAAQNFSVVHLKRKVIEISYRGSVFEVKKNLLRYGAEKNEFYYLGIYLLNYSHANFGGIIGEMVNAMAEYESFNNHDGIAFGSDHKLIQVYDGTKTDYLNGVNFECWVVPHIEDLLRKKLAQYRL